MSFSICHVGLALRTMEGGVLVDMLHQSVITDFAKCIFLPFVLFLQYLVLTCMSLFL